MASVAARPLATVWRTLRSNRSWTQPSILGAHPRNSRLAAHRLAGVSPDGTADATWSARARTLLTAILRRGRLTGTAAEPFLAKDAIILATWRVRSSLPNPSPSIPALLLAIVRPASVISAARECRTAQTIRADRHAVVQKPRGGAGV